MRCWNLRCEIALLCGALAGTLSPAERRASATSLHQTGTLRWHDKFSAGDRPTLGLVLETV
jgi:hypothetical protein